VLKEGKLTMPSTFADAAERADRAILRVFGRADGVGPVYTPKAGGGAYDVDGVLELPDANLDSALGEFTRFFVRLDDLQAAPALGDRLTIDGVQYIVDRIVAEEEGAARLILNKVD
jgi:hypothetical protein